MLSKRIENLLIYSDKKVCLDVDEIFLPHLQNVIEKIKNDGTLTNKLNEHVTYEDITGFQHMLDLYGEDGQAFFKLPEIYENMQLLIEGSKEMLDTLIDIVGKDRILFVTHSFDTTEIAKENALERLLNINLNDFNVVHTEHKSEYYKDNISIDDSKSHYEKGILDNNETVAIMPCYTWNEKFSHKNLFKVNTLTQFNLFLSKVLQNKQIEDRKSKNSSKLSNDKTYIPDKCHVHM